MTDDKREQDLWRPAEEPAGGDRPPPTGAWPGYGYGPPRAAGTNGLAVASLVLGILWIWWIGSVLAVIFGHVAIGQIRQTGQQGQGLAVAGLVLGYVGIGLLVLGIVGFAVARVEGASAIGLAG